MKEGGLPCRIKSITAASPPNAVPVKYGVENRIETDVLIIGAGVAGAIGRFNGRQARRKGSGCR
jgi:hypothetical protein